MRPVRIEICAFGPYAQRQAIDFGELNGHDLFLIHGPTGAGKTSILDAVCFALYGESSGDERQAKELRSHFADSAEETMVELVFALGDVCYRVRRRPEQERTARRGGGTARVAAAATLWRVDPARPAEEGEVLASGVRAVDERIRGILGFRADEFRQVAMLPQGRFREALVATSRDREAILGTLFDTALYGRITEELRRRAQALKTEHDLLCTRRDQVLAGVGVDGPPELTTALAEVEAERASLGAEIQARTATRDTARVALERGRRVEEAFTEHARAEEKVARIDEARPHHARDRERLARAQAAARIAAEVRLARDAARRAAAAEEEASAAGRALDEARRSAEMAESAWEHAEAAAPKREAAREAARRLVAALPRVRELAALTEQQREVEAEVVRRDQDRSVLLGERDELHQQIAKHDERLEAARAAQAEEPAAAETVRRLRERVGLHEDLDDATRRRDAERTRRIAAEEQLRRCMDELTAAERALEALRVRWLADHAHRLARELIDGVPCPVCGATDHPAPASPGTHAPTENELQAAEERFSAAVGARDRAQADLTEARFSWELADARRGEFAAKLAEEDGRPREAVVAELRERRTAHTALIRTAQEVEALVGVRRGLVDRRDEVERWLRENDGARDAAHKRAVEVAAQIEAHRRELGELPLKPDVLERELSAAQAHHQELIGAHEAARRKRQTSRERLATAEAHATAARDRARREAIEAEAAAGEMDGALVSAGFADAAAFGRAFLDGDAVAALEREVAAFEEEERVARRELTRTAARVRGLERPDLGALDEALRMAEGALAEAQRRWGQLDGRLEGLRRAQDQLDRIGARQAEVEAAYGDAARLHEVAAGRNAARMSLERYVLAAMLDRALAQASARLERMSRGRYRLRRAEVPVDQRGAGGLDIEVLDAYTGEPRRAQSLSGGEGFLAALGLALGLADVVQAQAGGVHLDALFIDEGFGALDAESLDHALAALLELNEGGRLIGLISHVADLRERIPAQLAVTGTSTGSAIGLVTG